MGDKTGISWTDATWNPLRGCSRVSKGCENCYAEKVAARFSGPGLAYEGLTTKGPKGARWNGQIKLVHEKLEEPLRWSRPRRVFVNSMSDLFHENVPDEFIILVFEVMATAAAHNSHTFQVLTKRPDRMRDLVSRMHWRFGLNTILGKKILTHRCAMDGVDIGGTDLGWAGSPPGVWLGVSVEDQETADERIPILLKTPAAVRFISAEPMLGPIHLKQQNPDGNWPPRTSQPDKPWLAHVDWPDDFEYAVANEHGINWCIVGGESGPGARPCDIEWIRSIVDQCRDARVPCFVKQLGSRPFEGHSDLDHCCDQAHDHPGQHPAGRLDPDGMTRPFRAKKSDDPSEWPADLRVQEFPE